MIEKATSFCSKVYRLFSTIPQILFIHACILVKKIIINTLSLRQDVKLEFYINKNLVLLLNVWSPIVLSFLQVQIGLISSSRVKNIEGDHILRAEIERRDFLHHLRNSETLQWVNIVLTLRMNEFHSFSCFMISLDGTEFGIF